MAALSIHSAEHKGELDKECLWLEVHEDIPSLSYYSVCDTTYTDDDHISNELRHVYWFPKKSVKKGDWLLLYTKVGKSSSSVNNHKTTTHTFYWQLGRTVWNKDGDAAMLFKHETWNTKRV